MTQKVCVKVNNLRKLGYESLKEWIADEKNLYVGRRGRIFITSESDFPFGKKEIFHYKGSRWQNPYKVTGKLAKAVEDSLRLYKKHLKESGLIEEISELEGLNLGCFCNDSDLCHAQLLVDLLDEKKIHQ